LSRGHVRTRVEQADKPDRPPGARQTERGRIGKLPTLRTPGKSQRCFGSGSLNLPACARHKAVEIEIILDPLAPIADADYLELQSWRALSAKAHVQQFLASSGARDEENRGKARMTASMFPI
jgi:hypothetical protein